MGAETSSNRRVVSTGIILPTLVLVLASVISFFVIQGILKLFEGGIKVRTAIAVQTFVEGEVELSPKVKLRVKSIEAPGDEQSPVVSRVTVVYYTLIHDDARNLKKGTEFALVQPNADEGLDAIPSGIVLDPQDPGVSPIYSDKGKAPTVQTVRAFPSGGEYAGFFLGSELRGGHEVKGKMVLNTSNDSEFEHRILLRPIEDGEIEPGPLEPAQKFNMTWAQLLLTIFSVASVYAMAWMLFNTYATHNYSTGSVILFKLFELVGLKRAVPDRFRHYQEAKSRNFGQPPDPRSPNSKG